MDSPSRVSAFTEPTVSLHDRLRRAMPRVVVTPLLIAANVLVFLAMLLHGEGGSGGVAPGSLPLEWGANFGPATQDGEWWRLASAMFLHFGFLHLGMNMWALWDGGQYVERMFGRARFTGIYALAGITGNLLSLVVHSGRGVSGGASGAIFGLYGALLSFLWRERRTLPPREFRWLFWGAALFSVAIIAFGLLVPGIDNAAHVGGFVSGALLGAALGPRASTERMWLSARLSVPLLLIVWLGLALRIPPPAYRWSDETAAREEIASFMDNEAAIARAWQEIIDESGNGASFDELAGRVDEDIVDSYERSFEHLAQVPVYAGLPSGPRIEALRVYAARRRDASRLLVDGLREGDASKVREAIVLEKRRLRQQGVPQTKGK